ncbi:MAG: ABC transporter substrate-binding protein [Sneathiella sp.]
MQIPLRVGFFAILLACSPARAEMRVLTTDEPPTNYKQQGKITGISVDIVRAMLTQMEQPDRIEMLPWARAYEIAVTKPNIVIFTAGRSQERIDHGFHFIGPLTSRKHILWKKKNSALTVTSDAHAVADGLSIVGLRQDWRTKYYKGLQARVMEVSSPKKGLQMLLLGRADLWISSDLEAPAVAEQVGVSMNALEIAHIFQEAPSYMMLSRDSDPKLIQDWRHAFSKLKETDFFAKMARKWSGILHYQLGHNPETGFYIRNFNPEGEG